MQGPAGSRLPTVLLCPLTSFVRDDVAEFRPSVPPGAANGLRADSQVMTDKLMVISRDKVRDHLGRLTDQQMSEVAAALSALLDLA